MAREYPAKGTRDRKKLSPRAELARAIDALGREPFPPRSADDRLDLLHAEMLLHDSSVGEAVMAVMNGERPPADELLPREDLRRNLEALAAGDEPAASEARAYLACLDRLDRLLALARAVRDPRAAG